MARACWFGAVLVVLLSTAVGGCRDGSPASSGAVAPTEQDRPQAGLPRVSPHGAVAPTLAAATTVETVEYYNPNTGTTSEYELEVDRDAEGKVERVNFPNGGWREIDGQTTTDADGSDLFIDDDGVEYTIRGRTTDGAQPDGEPE